MSARLQVRMKAEPTLTSVPAALSQRKCACGQHTIAGGECEACRKKRVGPALPGAQLLQRHSATQAEPTAVPLIAYDVLHSPGQPLAAATRAFFESRFGHDFSQVRVHTDARAAESARAVNALAYTVGRDVAFGAGQYAPRTVEGTRLLAHELTHVVQQRTLGGESSASLHEKNMDTLIQRQAIGDVAAEEAEEQVEGVGEEEMGGEGPEVGPATIESSTEEELPGEEEASQVSSLRLQRAAINQSLSDSWGLEREADAAADSMVTGRSPAIHLSVASRLYSRPQFKKAKKAAKAKKLAKLQVCGRNSVRNSDFPNTFITRIDVDVTSPDHSVTLTWDGPNKDKGEKGPFHSSPGAGKCDKDCDDEATSKDGGSDCTPKGTRKVELKACVLGGYPNAKDVTYFDKNRGIALHSFPSVPNYPASHGCVRLHRGAAQLIRDNSRTDVTEVTVSGTWTRGTIKKRKKEKPICYQ